MVLNDRVVRELRGAVPQEADRPLVDSALVQDPPQCVRDLRVLRSCFLGSLSELERLLLITPMLRIEPGQVVRRRSEAWIQREDLFVSLLRLRDVPLALVDD